jgi:hypothetical protein
MEVDLRGLFQEIPTMLGMYSIETAIEPQRTCTLCVKLTRLDPGGTREVTPARLPHCTACRSPRRTNSEGLPSQPTVAPRSSCAGTCGYIAALKGPGPDSNPRRQRAVKESSQEGWGLSISKTSNASLSLGRPVSAQGSHPWSLSVLRGVRLWIQCQLQIA